MGGEDLTSREKCHFSSYFSASLLLEMGCRSSTRLTRGHVALITMLARMPGRVIWSPVYTVDHRTGTRVSLILSAAFGALGSSTVMKDTGHHEVHL